MSRLIDVDALMESLEITAENCEDCQWVKEVNESGLICGRGRDFEDACIAIDLAPIVEERVKGVWLDNATSYSDIVPQTCTCSICGRRSNRPLGDFCRWCAADMRGEFHAKDTTDL